jgi:hypothetical protein
MKATERNEAIIQYFGQPCKIACDRNCAKAWGLNNRPKERLSSNPDDFAFLADSELGEAPADPGTYEGGHAKPLSPDGFPNKWCVRECERCAMSKPGQSTHPLALETFESRVFNIPRMDEE